MSYTERQFPFTHHNFLFLKKKVKQLSGINLTDSKNELVYSRVSRILRLHHLNSFDEYCNQLSKHNPALEKEFINAITTNFTSFMRENHHFDCLRKKIFPEIFHKNTTQQKCRIWSAGCSTGEEAYSISFILQEFIEKYPHWDAKILATDIDSDALCKAQTGVYTHDVVDDIPSPYRANTFSYFNLENPAERLYKIKEEYQHFIHFKYFNLMASQPWPMHGPFDVIFCRNVMIYFERESQYKVIDALTNLLNVNGFLILGHSESVPSFMQDRLKFIDRTIYRRVK